MQTNNITVPKVPEEAGGFWALGNTESVDDGLGGRAMNRKTFFYRDTQTVFFNYRVHRLRPEIFFFGNRTKFVLETRLISTDPVMLGQC